MRLGDTKLDIDLMKVEKPLLEICTALEEEMERPELVYVHFTALSGYEWQRDASEQAQQSIFDTKLTARL